MFEDEMTEDHMARTEEEYQRVTAHEIEEENLAQVKNFATALRGLACAIAFTEGK